MAINELRSISTFIKAAELGSLRQAASAQGITPQAASLALGQLESHLGVRLFHRTTRSLSLTEEGRQFLASAQPGLATLQHAVQGARAGLHRPGGGDGGGQPGLSAHAQRAGGPRPCGAEKAPRAKAHAVSAVQTVQAANPPSISKLAPVTMPDSGPAR